MIHLYINMDQMGLTDSGIWWGGGMGLAGLNCSILVLSHLMVSLWGIIRGRSRPSGTIRSISLQIINVALHAMVYARIHRETVTVFNIATRNGKTYYIACFDNGYFKNRDTSNLWRIKRAWMTEESYLGTDGEEFISLNGDNSIHLTVAETLPVLSTISYIKLTK